MAALPEKTMINMLKRLIEIRKFEEKAIELYRIGKIRGYLHPCIGQEAIPVGACQAIGRKDYIISNHRGHGHCIARGADIKKMMAELFGKSDGYCGGRGGSMHIADMDLGILGENGIVGGGIPMSVGAGLSCKMDDKGNVVLCFFGDGAANNGVFHEALNMSAILKLPVVYICENNMYAISMCSADSVACRDIGKRSCAYDIPGYIIDGSDPLKVYKSVGRAVKRAREGKGPSLIEAKTYRFYGHHPNDPAQYREKKEVEYYARQKDPVVNFKKRLLAGKVITAEEINKIEKKADERINDAVIFASESPEPDLKKFLKENKPD
ncbi:MAG TPA: thiamine pyrophosphate-dependent dehydrogenase E1 component subunit alpha [Candidatus Humimicrobiaceae bacterium]